MGTSLFYSYIYKKQGKLISTKNPKRLFKFIFLAKDESQYFKMYFGGNAIISSAPYAFTTSDLLSDEKIWYEYDDGERFFGRYHLIISKTWLFIPFYIK